jgi:hypothetical protein
VNIEDVFAAREPDSLRLIADPGWSTLAPETFAGPAATHSTTEPRNLPRAFDRPTGLTAL